MRAEQRSGRFIELDLVAYCRELAAELTLQGRNAPTQDWASLETFMTAHGIASSAGVPHRPVLTRAAQPVFQVANDWLGINPLNRPVGRFASVEDALTYDETRPSKPNSRHSGFLRSRDRVRLAAAGVPVA